MFIIRLLAILIISTTFYVGEVQGAMWPTNYTNVKHDDKGSQKNMEQEELLNSERATELGLQGNVTPASATSGNAGSGFSNMLSSAKNGLSKLKNEITEAINSVIKFFVGDGKIECDGLDNPTGVSACFYLDDSATTLSSSEIRRTKDNITKAMGISSKELLSEATTIVNSAEKYDEKKDSIETEGSSSEHITAALQNRTESELAFVNMTTTLLSMDIKRLEIESLATFQAINKAKQPLGSGNAAGGLSSIIGGAVGGLF